MSANVIQHRTPRRKREPAPAWSAWRVAVLVVAVIGVIAASWLALEPQDAAKAPELRSAPQSAMPALPPVAPELIAVDARADLAGAPAPQARRAAPRRTGVPLDAAGANPSDGYEILSAAELDGISQARD